MKSRSLRSLLALLLLVAACGPAEESIPLDGNDVADSTTGDDDSTDGGDGDGDGDGDDDDDVCVSATYASTPDEPDSRPGVAGSSADARLPIPCRLELPAPPDGETLAPDSARVELVAAPGADPEGIARVTDADGCADAPGWHFDGNDAPARVELCAATCARVQDLRAAELTLLLGCTDDVVVE